MINFENQAELDNVIKHLEAKQNYWTDMHDMGKENEFISITTGAPLKDFPKILALFYIYYILIQSVIYTNEQVYIERTKSLEDHVQANAKPFEKILDKYYYISHYSLNWYAALHKCHELGAQLVVLQNQQQFDAIAKKLHKKQRYWLDLNDLAEEGKFVSMTTGRAANFTRWAKIEPNNLNHNENCAQLLYEKKHKQHFRMNDNECTDLCHFICETNSPSTITIVVW
ncbi:C-type lectin 37Db-like [Drosophila busckii]|uniref:C-type lectin 37Db-like n=1 Tax=Drosophila busckii TaxID=30019 RepID=UPI00083E96BD|nr:C-type lectin 37Db-like [Drosophila busckii]